MDVAAFVGFAASGPLETPVAVETVAQFTAIFGGDAPLARDGGRGEQLNAYLAPAVRAFFLNGGQRCWVVRVARRRASAENSLNRARYNYFPIPGLARAQFDERGEIKSIRPAAARARSEGSWSDGLRVSAALLSRPVQVKSVFRDANQDLVIDLTGASLDDLAVGELLRLRFKEEGYVLMLAVKSIERGTVSSPLNADPLVGGRLARVTGGKAVWLREVTRESLPPPGASAEVATFTREHPATLQQELAADETTEPYFENRDEIRLNPSDVGGQPDADQTITFDLLNASLADAPPPGSVVRVGINGEAMWMGVERVGISGKGTESGELVRLGGAGLWWVESPPQPLPASTPAGERLSFELKAGTDEDYSVTLSDLAFDSGHKRFWGLLPTDEKLYREAEDGPGQTPAVVWWRPVGDIFRFPLAGGGGERELYFPVAMSPVHDHSLGPVRLRGTELERDGLARFEAALFLDERLLDVGTEDLLAEADSIRYLSPTPSKLNGIHAAFGKEEVTIIAVPDAVHRGWSKIPRADAPPASESLPPPRPSWWRFLGCDPRANVRGVPEPQWTSYFAKGGGTIPAPEFENDETPEGADALTLSWSSGAEQAEYILEEATSPDFCNAVRIYSGPDKRISVSGASGKAYYYRVRLEAGGVSSDWSQGVIRQGSIPLVRGSHDPHASPLHDSHASPYPLWGNFLDCDIRLLDPPELEASDKFTNTGTFTLTWSSALTETGVKYVLEEATGPDFGGAVTVYEGAQTRLTIYGRRPGDYYYRARVLLGGNTSDWSAGVSVRIAAPDRWRVDEEDEYTPDALLAVQRALLRMCAARGDLFAVLSLPEHYREDKAIEHVAALKATPERRPPTEGVPALGYGEAKNFSYGAIYHPWLVGSEDAQAGLFRRTPPCGAACGVMAHRALSRGAWVAPANETMSSVVALAPPILRGRRPDLQGAQINLIRQEPRGFLTLSADTLSDDEELRPINVRRLLMLLRRQALRLGTTYVFEPESNSFRRLVERGFAAMLEGMYALGAFAGSTAANAYRVSAGDDLNTPQGIEQGRFVVELRVAPSRPLTFLTIRLVQTGGRGFVAEGR
jgi:hypothetical protein